MGIDGFRSPQRDLLNTIGPILITLVSKKRCCVEIEIEEYEDNLSIAAGGITIKRTGNAFNVRDIYDT